VIDMAAAPTTPALLAWDRDRAARFAADNGVERAADSYRELLADPDVEVVYNALPNSLRGPWNVAAIRAGKHVLSEKPFAGNADEARRVAAVTAASDRVVFDGFHYRYHPIFDRFLTAIAGGGIGALRSLRVRMTMPPPGDNDLRWSLRLAGGAMMDLGCYAPHAVATVAGVLGGVPEVVEGTDDRLIVYSPRGGERVEHLGTRSSYHYQIDALTAAVRFGSPFPTNAADAVANLVLIDQCYRMAGLPARPPNVHTAKTPSKTS
jgi:hypothetical protein